MKKISKNSQAIKSRFLRAYEELRYRGLVGTKREFAEVLDMSQSNLTRIEAAETYEPTLTHVSLLIEKYNVSPAWIMTGEGNFLLEK